MDFDLGEMKSGVHKNNINVTNLETTDMESSFTENTGVLSDNTDVNKDYL